MFVPSFAVYGKKPDAIISSLTGPPLSDITLWVSPASFVRNVTLARDKNGLVGITFEQLKGAEGAGATYVVKATSEGSPARESGLVMPGDYLPAVDGVQTAGLSPEEMAQKIKGAPGKQAVPFHVLSYLASLFLLARVCSLRSM